MAKQRLVTRAEFSRQAGVSGMAVTKAARGCLVAATKGKYIDIDHPTAIKYIRSKQCKETPPPAKKAPPKPKAAPKSKKKAAPKSKKKAAPKSKKKAAPAAEEESHYSKDNDLVRVLHMTIGELLKEFGTDEQFKRWVDAKKVIAETRHKELNVAKAEGVLISRDVVKTHIFGAMESSNMRLLTDTPKTLARRLYSLAKSGAPIEEAEALARKLIEDQLRNVKVVAKRVLKG